jgi:hypothetical protein
VVARRGSFRTSLMPFGGGGLNIDDIYKLPGTLPTPGTGPTPTPTPASGPTISGRGGTLVPRPTIIPRAAALPRPPSRRNASGRRLPRPPVKRPAVRRRPTSRGQVIAQPIRVIAPVYIPPGKR